MTTEMLMQLVGFATVIVIGAGALGIALHHKHKQNHKHS